MLILLFGYHLKFTICKCGYIYYVIFLRTCYTIFKPKSKACFFLLCEYFYACYDLFMALSVFVQLIGPETGFVTGGAGRSMRYLVCFFKCFFSLVDPGKALLQRRQKYGFSPVCFLI